MNKTLIISLTRQNIYRIKATLKPRTMSTSPTSAIINGIQSLKINQHIFTQNLPNDKSTPSVADTPTKLMRTPRQVHHAAYSYVVPELPPKPSLECVSPSALSLINLKVSDFDCKLNEWPYDDKVLLTKYFSGSQLIPNSEPWAHMYAGHQFGSFAGQLGDGRAISLGQIKTDYGFETNHNGIWELQLKGAGNTPYSRFGDGFAVLRSSIREFLCSEHFSALGIPTSRAGALLRTGQPVHREKLEPGAIVLRLAPSWIRFGSFEGFAFRGDLVNTARLVDYCIQHVMPPNLSTSKTPTVNMYAQVVEQTAKLVAQWDLFAWQHGVMNTDNMSILGITIDYGPFGFLDNYDRDFAVNHSDSMGRYTLHKQKSIGLYNLGKLANTLIEIVGYETSQKLTLRDIMGMPQSKLDDVDARRKVAAEYGCEPLAVELRNYDSVYNVAFTDGMRQKLGLYVPDSSDKEQIIDPLLDLLELAKADYTHFFRRLSTLQHNGNDKLERLILKTSKSQMSDISKSSVSIDRIQAAWHTWRDTYLLRLQKEQHVEMTERTNRMNKVNPKYVLRPWIAQQTIDACEAGDEEAVARALCVLTDPYADVPKDVEQFSFSPLQWYERWAEDVPEWGMNLTCSCSS